MRKVAVLLAVLVAVVAGTASGAPTETGVTAKTVTIGGTFPLTGPASLYAPIPVAMKAYFSWINARKGPDGKRGVGGRQIVFNYYDDGYNPANSVQLTRKLVEQDKVFAVVGSLGTEVNLAIRPYLNAHKVPQLLNATGATVWGLDQAKYPWTIGWQPPYSLESKIYGQADRAEQPQREDRRPLPERRLRQGLPRRSQGRPRREVVEHRRRGGVRGDRDDASPRRSRSCAPAARRSSSSSRRRSSPSRRT